MGDPISPGMTIGACAWMEKEWMNAVDNSSKKFFRAKRFMDDILLIYAQSEDWAYDTFLKDFKQSECYWSPLTLEKGKEDTFLETRFKVSPDGRDVSYRLKNNNEGNGESQIWRYQHFHSYGNYTQKRATLLASLRKVHHMASDSQQLFFSGVDKLKEFANLEYPKGIRKFMCGIMARDTDDFTWYRIMQAQNAY